MVEGWNSHCLAVNSNSFSGVWVAEGVAATLADAVEVAVEVGWMVAVAVVICGGWTAGGGEACCTHPAKAIEATKSKARILLKTPKHLELFCD